MRVPYPAISLVSGLISGETGYWMKRAKRRAIVLSLAGVLFVSVWALVVTAGVIALARTTDPLTATLSVAGIIAAVALLLIAGLMVMERFERRKVRRRQANTSLYATAAMVALPMIIRSRPLMLLALAAGGSALLAKALGSDSSDESDSDYDT
jgi:ABC-type xylose transport system permease subunit